ncbi:TPA: hypothetical protein ACGO1T_001589 [Streptococcus suis]
MKNVFLKLKVEDRPTRLTLAEIAGQGVSPKNANNNMYFLSEVSTKNHLKNLVSNMKSENYNADDVESDLVYFYGNVMDRLAYVTGRGDRYKVDDFVKKLFITYTQLSEVSVNNFYNMQNIMYFVNIIDEVEAANNISLWLDSEIDRKLVYKSIKDKYDSVDSVITIEVLLDYLFFIGRDNVEFRYTDKDFTVDEVYKALVVNAPFKYIDFDFLDEIGNYVGLQGHASIILGYFGAGSVHHDIEKDGLRRIKKSEIDSNKHSVKINDSYCRTIQIDHGFEVIEKLKNTDPRSLGSKEEYVASPFLFNGIGRRSVLNDTYGIGATSLKKESSEGLKRYSKDHGLEEKLTFYDIVRAGKVRFVIKELLKESRLDKEELLYNSVIKMFINFGEIPETDDTSSFRLKVNNYIYRDWKMINGENKE